MSAVGLLYVGAVLFINGLMLLGHLTPREAAPINLFVGGLQILTPTALLIMAGGDVRAVFAASGLYLFGFTYLWVGVNGVLGWSDRGLGWFSLFVAMCAVVYAVDSFTIGDDAGFGVIWLAWSVLWFLFFLVLGLGLTTLGAATGAFTLVAAFVTAAIPAFLILFGRWSGSVTAAAVIAAVVVVTLALCRNLGPRFAARPREEVAD